jgi:hypothetical protein
MLARWLLRAFIAVSLAVVVGSLAWTIAYPAPSLRADRHGVPHITPPTVHPYTGETLRVEELVEHYKGVKR